MKNKCVKGSLLLSILAKIESDYYINKKIYSLVDKYIFPSRFMQEQHIGNGVSAQQSTVLHNFSRIKKRSCRVDKSDNKYVLFFGRIGREKGSETLLEVCKMMPEVKFLIVGKGEMENSFENLSNCNLLGFKSGKELEELISNATCTVLPSIWYENCPMSVLESISLGTPVIGSNIGGIPELIENEKTGYVFESGNSKELADRIRDIYFDDKKSQYMSEQCLLDNNLMNVNEYVEKLLQIYESVIK